jgi:hypothetical protein
MGLFSKSQPVDDPIPERGGKHVLRTAISLRLRKKENLQRLVLDLQTPLDGIIAFANGADNLNPDHLSILAKYIFSNVVYDADKDLLASTAPPVTTFAAAGYPPRTTSSYPPVVVHCGPPPPQPKSEGAGSTPVIPPYKPKAGWLIRA